MPVAQDAGHGFQVGGGDGEPQLGEAVEEPRKGDGSLGPGQRCPKAEVNAVTEGDV
jgi:hypothetical protein